MKLRGRRVCVVAVSLVVWGALSAAAAPPVTFHDIAAGGGAGLTYSRTPSARLATWDSYTADGIINVETEYRVAPYKPHGAPGVAVLDYNNDGYPDIYVTNGPGTANSLFKNRLGETGHLEFVDVAQQAGVALTGQDSQGVCAGDIDNDGFIDLFVVGYGSNHLLKNLGNGTFQDITVSSGTGGTGATSTSCAMGDVNGDGLLDILVANAFDFATIRAFGGTYAFNQPNQLLINRGGDVFTDESESSGIRVLAGVPTPGIAVPSWAVSLVDINMDGNLDAVIAGDTYNQLDAVGFPRIFINDGTGHFTDRTYEMHMNVFGSWRGLAFGDLNCDGRLDMFVSNFGDYVVFPGLYPPGTWASRWFLGQSDGTFSDPGVGSFVTTPTGWGATITDYDNDGSPDIIYHGGWDYPLFWDESNRGVLLNNQGCSATFTWDTAALAGSTNHLDRNVEGLATGDFNRDGFVDVVTLSSFDLFPGTLRVPLFSAPLGSPFDVDATFVPASVPTSDPNIFAWLGIQRKNGTLAVEINSGNSNHWAAFNLVGAKGLINNHISAGAVNRSGIGAIVRFKPQGGKPTLNPVLAGSSYASQNSLTVEVGMGTAIRGTVDVLWPGGVKNRLYDVHASERLTLPEIPCGFDSTMSSGAYAACVTASLADLTLHHVVTIPEAARLEVSALLAYAAAH